jgi:hypothetical protein
MYNRFKYIEVKDGTICCKTTDETIDVAMSIALGADYGLYDIDPMEAYVLACHIKEFAKKTHNPDLLQNCTKSLRQLKLHCQAYQFILDKP